MKNLSLIDNFEIQCLVIKQAFFAGDFLEGFNVLGHF